VPASNHADRGSSPVPLVRLGQGDFVRDIHAEDIQVTAATALDLRALIREPADVYHARAGEHLSSHALAEFRRCPALFRKRELGLIPERDSEAFAVGRAAHVLILEGRERFEAEFAVGGPINPKTGQPFGSSTKAFAEWAERLGKPAIDDSQAATIGEMASSVRAHPIAASLLADGVAERVVRCDYRGHRCQGRLDWINPDGGRGIVDLKTCEKLDWFEGDLLAFGYPHQLAFYRALLSVVWTTKLPVHVVAVEKREPYRTGVWRIADRVLDQAERENEQAMDELAHCRRSGLWPTRFESLRTFDRT
jgi:hypothetical protein